LERYLQDLEERRLRRRVRTVVDEREALQLLNSLAAVRRRRPAELAAMEVMTLLERMPAPARARLTSVTTPRAPTAYWLRALLGQAYSGKCQLCGFTFSKSDGTPFFEVHHIEPTLGDHPKNLLVVCANCHAKLTYAEVDSFVYADGWLVELRLAGARVSVRQLFRRPTPDQVVLFHILLILSAYATRSRIWG
jgi:hypothetical protein